MNHSKTMYVTLITSDGRSQVVQVLVPASSGVENKFALEMALMKAGLTEEDVVSGSVLERPPADEAEVRFPGSPRSSFGEHPFGRCRECGGALSINRNCLNLAGHISA